LAEKWRWDSGVNKCDVSLAWLWLMDDDGNQCLYNEWRGLFGWGVEWRGLWGWASLKEQFVVARQKVLILAFHHFDTCLTIPVHFVVLKNSFLLEI